MRGYVNLAAHEGLECTLGTPRELGRILWVSPLKMWGESGESVSHNFFRRNTVNPTRLATLCAGPVSIVLRRHSAVELPCAMPCLAAGCAQREPSCRTRSSNLLGHRYNVLRESSSDNLYRCTMNEMVKGFKERWRSSQVGLRVLKPQRVSCS